MKCFVKNEITPANDFSLRLYLKLSCHRARWSNNLLILDKPRCDTRALHFGQCKLRLIDLGLTSWAEL